MNCFLLDRGDKGWLGFIVWLILVDCFTLSHPSNTVQYKQNFSFTDSMKVDTRHLP